MAAKTPTIQERTDSFVEIYPNSELTHRIREGKFVFKTHAQISSAFEEAMIDQIKKDKEEEAKKIAERVAAQQAKNKATPPATQQTTKENKVMAKKANSKVENSKVENNKVETNTNINRIQYQVLAAFTEEDMTVADIAANLEKSTGNAKIVHAQLGMLAKKGLVEVYQDKQGVKCAKISEEGKELADGEMPEAAPKAPTKPKYEPLYSEEELDGMKKKARKAAIEEMKEHKEQWMAENKTEGKRTQSKSSNPSEYDGKIKPGKWQTTGKVGPVRAAWDLWEQIVTPELLITKAEYVARCADHGINDGSAKQQWRMMTQRYNITKEQALAAGAISKGKKKATPTTKGNVTNIVEATTDKNQEGKKKDKQNKKDKKDKKSKKA